MASKQGNGSGGGCAALIAVLIAIVAVLWTVSAIGHALGLTPTYSELTDRPHGWMGSHYRGVVWGYALTVTALAMVGALAWLAIRARSDDPRRAAEAYEWLRRAGIWAFVLLVAIVFLPIGRRPGGSVRANTTTPAHSRTVPDVVGLSATDAEARVDAAYLSADFQELPSDEDRCTIVSQDPPAGAALADDGTVELRCQERIPRVVGMKADDAESRLIDAGFDARFANEPADGDLTRCRVLRQRPSGATAPGATIGLRLRCAQPKPEPAPASTPAPTPSSPQCDPNYTGACLKPDSPDYDCAGGSGDGPDYTGPVTVVGVDHYGLDRDGDGHACE